jgi:hypothetical protein
VGAGRRSIRRARPALAALCAGVVVAGVALAPAAASPASGGPAFAAAMALNLQSSDLPASQGWKTVSAPSQATLHRVDAQQSSCYGGQYGHVLADVQSPAFSKGNVSVSSDVEIFATPAEAAADLRALSSALGEACEQTSIRTLSVSKTQPLDSIRAATVSIPSPLRGVSGLIGQRSVLELLNPAQHPPSTVKEGQVFDEFIFLRAQAEVAVSVTTGESAKPTLPPAALERSLMALLVARSKTLG